MKKIAFNIAALAIVTLLASCNEEPTVTETAQNEAELVAAVIAPPVPETKYVYVTAPSGLSLREYNNLDSKKMAVMPYGTKLEVLSLEKNNTMTVAGISGGMHQVEYNNKVGYAFNGFLSNLFPPEKNGNAARYIEDLKATHPSASYKKVTGGTASAPTVTRTIVLPTDRWHEAFYTAQQLFSIPKTFAFPSVKGKEKQTIQDRKKESKVLTSELAIERLNNDFKKLAYTRALEKYNYQVVITKQGNSIKIVETEIVK